MEIESRENFMTGVYDQDTIHSIIDSAPVVHVSFLPGTLDDDPFPAILPMLGCIGSFTPPNATESSAPALYLHGHSASRLMKLPTSNKDAGADGTPVCVAATHVDGLVLAYTPFNHSCNYRSAIVHGWAHPVTDPAEKMYALELITNNIVPERWDNSRVPPTEAEMTSTGVLRVDIVSASAKVRAAAAGNDKADLNDVEMRERVWTGVVPMWATYGDPISGVENRVKEVPQQLKNWFGTENARQSEYSTMIATKSYPGKS